MVVVFTSYNKFITNKFIFRGVVDHQTTRKLGNENCMEKITTLLGGLDPY